MLLRGLGYESNEASVVTNVSSDHMDLQGIHTLPELAEVKSIITKVTKPDGWIVLNADDRHVAAIARTAKARVALFSLQGDRSARIRRHLVGGGRAYLVRDAVIGEADGSMTWRPFGSLADIPIVLGGAARHNVANALAAVAAARAMGASIESVKRGLRTFIPSSEDSRGRLNVFRDRNRIVVVDFAHNEAGVGVLMDVVDAIARSASSNGRRAPISAIVGLAGDRPDDTLRGVGKLIAGRVDRFVQKEMIHYLRGRTREAVLGEIRAGALEGGWKDDIPVYIDEPTALGAELDRTADATSTEVIVLLCHEDREGVYDLIAARGLTPVEDPRELAKLVSSR
jgi:cyanophycin synthetase